MRQIREVLRLYHALPLSGRQIGQSLGLHHFPATDLVARPARAAPLAPAADVGLHGLGDRPPAGAHQEPRWREQNLLGLRPWACGLSPRRSGAVHPGESVGRGTRGGSPRPHLCASPPGLGQDGPTDSGRMERTTDCLAGPGSLGSPRRPVRPWGHDCDQPDPGGAVACPHAGADGGGRHRRPARPSGLPSDPAGRVHAETPAARSIGPMI